MSAVPSAPSKSVGELVKPLDTYAQAPTNGQTASFSASSSSSSSSASSGESYPSSASSSAMNYSSGHPRHSPFTSRLLSRPTPANSVFLVCDIQENFRDKMHQWPLLVTASTFLTRLAHQLDIPILVTEQKPFKPTIAELRLSDVPHTLHTKTQFSMLTPSVLAELKEKHAGRTHIFLYGIESHVCVMQTALDLLRHAEVEYSVHLPLDAITSMWALDMEAAVERWQGLPLVITTAECAFFELVGDAANPAFKPLMPHLKQYAAVKLKFSTAKGGGAGNDMHGATSGGGPEGGIAKL